MGQFGDENKRASDDSDPTQKQAGEREGIPTTVVKATETPPNPPATDNPQTRGERYFYLGTQAALVVITGIGIAIAICTLKSLNKSVNAANKQAAAAATQATIAREQFEATQRAWIGVDSVEVKNVARIPQSSYSFSIFVNGRNFAPCTRNEHQSCMGSCGHSRRSCKKSKDHLSWSPVRHPQNRCDTVSGSDIPIYFGRRESNS